jgi:hypothetical protein
VAVEASTDEGCMAVSLGTLGETLEFHNPAMRWTPITMTATEAGVVAGEVAVDGTDVDHDQIIRNLRL